MTLSNFGHCPVRERGPTATDAENNGSANVSWPKCSLAKSVWDFRTIFTTLHFLELINWHYKLECYI